MRKTGLGISSSTDSQFKLAVDALSTIVSIFRALLSTSMPPPSGAPQLASSEGKAFRVLRATHLLRVRYLHAWAVLSGRIFLPKFVDELQYMPDLSAPTAAVAAFSGAADRLIALNSSNAAACGGAGRSGQRRCHYLRRGWRASPPRSTLRRRLPPLMGRPTTRLSGLPRRRA